MSYKKIFLLGFIVVILIAIPFSVYIAQKRQQITTEAAASTSLSLEPTSSTIKVGDILSLSIMLNPGAGTPANQVSFVKLSINFDSTKFTVNSLEANSQSPNTLTTIVEDSKYESGKATLSLSIGADPTKVVTALTKIATLQLTATAETTPTGPNITFDSVDTQVLSIASSDQTSENVLSTTNPATVTVTSVTTTVTSTLTPTPTSTNTLTSTPTPTQSAITNNPPTCSALNIDRQASGTAPYSLTFTVVGNDSNGTISKVSLNFGDGPIQVLTSGEGIGTDSVSSQVSHTYNNAGIYTAYAILTDNNNNLSTQQDSCTKTITVNLAQASSGSGSSGSTQATNQSPTQTTLPPTGPGEKILSIGAIGAILTLIGGALLILL